MRGLGRGVVTGRGRVAGTMVAGASGRSIGTLREGLPAMTDAATPSDDTQETGGRAGRRGRGGAEARRALRRGGGLQQLKYISRKIPLYEVLKTDGLELIEHNADTVLEEIGLEFRDDE